MVAALRVVFAAACLQIAGTDRIGMVVAAETAGLVGAALRRSPVEPIAGGDLFAYPSIRSRLTFTAERAFVHSLTLTAGIVSHGHGRSSITDRGAERRGRCGRR